VDKIDDSSVLPRTASNKKKVEDRVRTGGKKVEMEKRNELVQRGNFVCLKE